MTTPYKKLQRRTFQVLDGEVVSRTSVWTEYFIATLVVLNVIVIILESVPEIHTAYAGPLHAFDFFSVVVFSVEYVLRVWSAGAKYPPNTAGKSGRREYIFSFYGLVDFFSTIPFYLQLLFPGADLRVLRMFRLLRIFKLSRYNSAFDDMIAAVKSERDSFSSAIFLMFIASLLFSSMIYIIEGHAQPEVFPSIPAAMHWFFITIIAGWGNIEPITFVGSVLVILTQVLSIALAAILTGVVATAYTAQVERREALYEMELREILADGVVTDEEQERLKSMQAKFGMTDAQVEALIEQMEEEKRLSQNQASS
jgi:voltage-gated potassium channel